MAKQSLWEISPSQARGKASAASANSNQGHYEHGSALLHLRYFSCRNLNKCLRLCRGHHHVKSKEAKENKVIFMCYQDISDP